jgi:hypothetical protein
MEVAMAISKVFTRPEKEEIRLQLLASMLANSNRNYSKKTHGIWHSFWQDILRGEKIFQ